MARKAQKQGLGGRIKKIRLQKKITISSLAEQIGVTRQTVSSIEKGGFLGAIELVKISEALGCSPLDLIEKELTNAKKKKKV